jgi:hypothetical protein
MKIAYMSNGWIKVVTPQQMGKLIAKISREGAWTKAEKKVEVSGPLTTVKWVTGNPEWLMYSITYMSISEDMEKFIEFGRRSNRLVAEVLGLQVDEEYPMSALLIQEKGEKTWSWDDSMNDGPTLRSITNMAKMDGYRTKIIKPTTLFKMWKKGLIV